MVKWPPRQCTMCRFFDDELFMKKNRHCRIKYSKLNLACEHYECKLKAYYEKLEEDEKKRKEP